jgi:hypothetical protein
MVEISNSKAGSGRASHPYKAAETGARTMRFITSEWSVKRNARRLKNALQRHGRELQYTKCLDLIAKLYGFAHFSELKRVVGNAPTSPLDDDVDDSTLEKRFQRQERVMAEAGFADIAGPLLDELNPTGRRKRSTAFDDTADEIAHEPDADEPHSKSTLKEEHKYDD